MTIEQARRISERVSSIAELSAVFFARHGSSYRMGSDTPAQSWELYREFMAQQARIASLLDHEALLNPNVRYERWWERRDVINPALVNELSAEATRLLERCAYLQGRNDEAAHESLLAIQQTIAGLLHPMTRMSGISTPAVR